jgi:hypothetical protein
MAIFAVLQSEGVVQVGDKTRLDARQSFVSPYAAVTKVEIKPDADTDYITVSTSDDSSTWYLVYSAAASVTATVRVTSTTTNTGTAALTVVTSATDALFSDDSDLLPLEPSLHELLPEGRSTYLNVHREAQTKIMDAIYRAGIRDEDDDRLTKAAVIDVLEVQEWSKYLTLQLIFEGLSNAVGDVFQLKAEKYRQLVATAANAATIVLDLDGDGDAETPDERVSMTEIKVRRA